MKVHVLKLRKNYYDDVESGLKSFEIRKNDRSYRVGDVLVLQEVETTGKELTYQYTGREILKQVVYMTDFMQRDLYVVLGIAPITYEALNEIFDDKKAALLMQGYDFETIRHMPVEHVDQLYAKEKKKGFKWEKLTVEN